MDFELPTDIADFLAEIDQFIDAKIRPLENMDDNIRFFDHRREDARTDWDRQGLPNEEWEALLRKAKDLAIDAGIFNYPFPAEYGGRDGGADAQADFRAIVAADVGTGTPDGTKFLRDDMSWQTPAGGSGGALSNVITSPTTVNADTSYIVAGYLSVQNDFTVNGNLMVIG